MPYSSCQLENQQKQISPFHARLDRVSTLFLAALNTENLFGESAMRLEVQETLLMGTFANRELSALLTHYSHWIPNVTPGMPLHSLTRGKTGST
jgi:hypothetical protein